MWSKWNWAAVLFILSLGLVAACAPEPQTTRESGRAALTPRSSGQFPVATAELPPTVPFNVDGASPGASGMGQPATPRSWLHYGIDAVLDWTAHTVRVEQRISYRNETGSPLDRIVLNVPTDQFDLRFVKIGSRRIRDYVLDQTRLDVPLKEALPPGDTVDLVLDFSLDVPPIKNGYRWGHLGYWGYSERQVNLGTWFPTVAVYTESQRWITPRFHAIGEYLVLEAADFTVDITVDGASDKLRLAGPGTVTKSGDNTWHLELTGAREVTLSLSEEFQTMSTSTTSGVEIQLYYFSDSTTGTLDAPRHALYTAADALALYEELYAAYPYERLVVVQGDFPDGMEFSGLVFVSDDWFRTWQGIPNDWLTLITAHEVAHQWWYALVGNDQGNVPYMDEALATYSEFLFLERYYPDYLAWWWEFRVAPYEPQGFVDVPVYSFDGPRPYINAVYLRGAQMMQALRDALGDEAFFEWLRAYAAAMGGKVAGPADLWGALPDDAYAAIADIRQRYLQQYNVLLPVSELP